MKDELETRMRAHWLEAADALTPPMQGRLRAARRTALSAAVPVTRAPRGLLWIGLPATGLAAFFAIALLVSRGDGVPVAPVTADASSVVGTDVAAAASGAPEPENFEGLTFEDDPDFYLWLAGDEPRAIHREMTDEPT